MTLSKNVSCAKHHSPRFEGNTTAEPVAASLIPSALLSYRVKSLAFKAISGSASDAWMQSIAGSRAVGQTTLVMSNHSCRGSLVLATQNPGATLSHRRREKQI
jgi:hypothetical protein